MDIENLNSQILIQAFSAFTGAFFAFLFLRLAEFFSKIYERQVRHFNSLIILETQLNELMGIISDNIYLIPFFKTSITSGNIYFSKLRFMPVDKSHYGNLHDLELINDLFSYNYQLRKLNDDLESLTDGYSDIKNAYIQHNIQKQDYLINAQISAEMLITLEIFLKDMEKHTIQLMAKVRLMSKRDAPLGTRIARLFIHTSGSKLKKNEIENEVKILRKEIEEIKRSSKMEIDNALKKANLSRP